MPASQIDRALRILKMEATMTTAQQLELWLGRREAATLWAGECQLVIDCLLDGRSGFEMDVVVEAPAPPAADPLPGEPCGS